MKKLIPALCMLVVAAMLLGTSTFAWFTMNTSVSATGMSVKAQASGGLLISTFDSSKTGDDRFPSGFKASVAAVITDCTSLSPVSTVDLDTWFNGMAAAVDSYAVDSTGYTDVTSTADGNYYLLNKFAIKTAGGAADTENDLVVSAVSATSTTTKSTALNESLRVAVKLTEYANGVATSNTVTKFFAPFKTASGETTDISWNAVQATTGTKLAAVSGHANLGSTDTVTLWEEIPALSIVEIYVYYEGEDAACKTNNTVNGVDELTVSVSFSAVEHEEEPVTPPATPDIEADVEGADLTATTSNVPGTANPTYQWYYSESGTAGSWSIINDATALTYTATQNGYYYCVMTIDSTPYESNTVEVDSITE